MFFRIPNKYFFSLGNHLHLLLLSSCYSQEEKWLYKQYPMIPSVAILKGHLCLSLHPVHPPIPPSICLSISHRWKGGTWHPACLLLLWRLQQPLCNGLPISLLCLIAGHYSLKSCWRCYLFGWEVRKAAADPTGEAACTGEDIMYLGYVTLVKRSWRMEIW